MSEGFAYLSDLEYLGQNLKCPMYAVLGNHEIHGSSFAKVHDGIRLLTAQYKNLIWMDDAGIVELNKQTCLIGNTNWFDFRIGNENYFNYTLDWALIEDFRKLPTMKDRLQAMRDFADDCNKAICYRLKEAIENYKSIYLLCHIPPWRECNAAKGWFNQVFLEPYNTSYALGQKIEKIMCKHKKRHLTVLAGHCHAACTAEISRNITCHVGKGSYSKIGEKEIIFI
jgi:hypothetical protein